MLTFKPPDGQHIELNAIHESVQEVLHQADLIVRRSFGCHLNFSKKLFIQPATDIVTEVDVVIENLLKQELARILPGAGFIGEETEKCVAQNYNWIVDPLDGTLNFANKIPIFCISVALWQNNVPLYGVVSLPMQNEVVHAIAGTGLFINGLPSGKRKRPPFRSYPCLLTSARARARRRCVTVSLGTSPSHATMVARRFTQSSQPWAGQTVRSLSITVCGILLLPSLSQAKQG